MLDFPDHAGKGCPVWKRKSGYKAEVQRSGNEQRELVSIQLTDWKSLDWLG